MSSDLPMSEPAGTPLSDVRLPGFLHETYTQYETDTGNLTNWLMTTATTLDYQFASTLAPDSAPKSASGNSKRTALHAGKGGKPRKVNNRHRQQMKAAASSDKTLPNLRKKIGDAAVSVPKSVLKWTL
ncbi:hypothetical protein AMAG_13258 [Allomyces macrogynus ATCC 38327]|uniref:Uncharacterized protein n=1 Tax=Allomyces macrogynus (strain ATCC 38327) TaxID=578462 RepID=A0A0L0T0I5_ALLM3|nr:hypothetical protein AMAG_13258 [Allomyces macrogynus ATCC 38327]|eukprot:KNE68089.1 hypothetical protein AMAG_13258 [Allomyces macrogynus ATCC 38327]